MHLCFMKLSDKDKYSGLSICGLILCAGNGSRTNLGYNKMLYYIGKKTILEMTLDRFKQSRVQSIWLVISPDDEQTVKQIAAPYSNINYVYGGDTRTESVRMGLNELGHCDIVVIHDGARPYVTAKIINSSIESAAEYGSGIVAVPTVDTIKEIKHNDVVRTLSRAGLFNIQTPQAFSYDEITDAYNKVPGNFNDDSEVYERAGYVPKIVIGDYDNVKVTTTTDLYRGAPTRTKVGVGFDVHRLVSGRPLILGGVRIPHYKGLKGHSDADVLTHAVMDALLSAASMPDIGVLFPDNNPAYSGISSMLLLNNVMQRLTANGCKVNNVSAVVMAEKPLLAPYIPTICASLAQAMNITPEQINVSATTTEQLGIIGNEKGIASSATCMIYV